MPPSLYKCGYEIGPDSMDNRLHGLILFMATMPVAMVINIVELL